jgi:glucosamine kinase
MGARTTVVLGIDGGGTSTRALLADDAGAPLGAGTAGPANPQVVGVDATREAIDTAVRAACAEADIERASIASIFLGMAGVAAASDRAAIRSIVSGLGFAEDIVVDVDHDLRIAHAGGLGGDAGIVLISGTGSSCYGRTANGDSWRSGGWGPLIDDVGSGTWLGIQALAAVARAIDGRGAATALGARLAASLGIEEASELLRLTGREGLPRDRIAALALEVLAAADDGDDVARAIILRGIDELALCVDGVYRSLEWEHMPVPCVLVGGLMTNHAYRSALERTIAGQTPHVEIREAQKSPVEGAVMLALRAGGR